MRCLHIGPGRDKLPGFDTLDIRPGYDIQADAAGPLPISDGSYDLIYASHIIEHIPWWKTIDTLKEWRRVLTVGGKLEIWTVDAAKVAAYLLGYENDSKAWSPDNWKRHNPTKNPYLWAAGRIFAYGDSNDDPNWHKALFTPVHLKQCLEAAGFQDTYLLDRSRVRGKDHGWVNLGICGIKASHSDPCKVPADRSDQPTTPLGGYYFQRSTEHRSPEPPEVSSLELCAAV